MPNNCSSAPGADYQAGQGYRAFIEPDALAKWLPPNGYHALCISWMRRLAAALRYLFATSLQTRAIHSAANTPLVPNRRVRYTDRFDDPNLIGEIQVTVTLKPVS
jgi:uncharacterized protein YndB with AHSA1/START domain